MTDHETAEAHHIEIVILDALVRGKVFMDQACPHVGHFVRGHGGAHATPTNSYTALHLSARNCAGQGDNKVRVIVVRLKFEVAEIDDFMTGRAQSPDQISL